MHILVAYDVATSTPGGVRRLRQVAKACQDYGQRVQYSLFECKVDPAQLVQLKQRLLHLIDPSDDSLRFYLLGANPSRRIEHYGAKRAYDIDGPLIVD